MNNDTFKKLAEPFPPDAMSWRPGSLNREGTRCLALAYANVRAYMDRLDQVCGADWSVEYQPWGQSRIIARLTIGGTVRCSTGEADPQDEKNNLAGSVMESMAFRRACAMFNLGRYIYNLEDVWVEFDAQKRRISDNGQRELEQRYKAWYAKTMANANSNSLTAVNELSASVANPFDGDAPAVGHEEMSPHQRLWASGLKCFHDDWDMARPWLLKKWTTKVTPANVRTSAGDLSDEEKTQLADYLGELCSELRKVWPRQKAMMLQSTN